MCGIYGIVGKEAKFSPDRRLLRRMGKTLKQRGPDDQGQYVAGPAGLGATRLSIIDIKGGNQPLFNEDKSIWVVQNGELYNYQELKNQLENLGHKFSSQSDTEVYAHLYEEEGLQLVSKLRGMYALGLWDAKRQRLVLGRDRLGIKPLYYTQHNGQLIFASEIKAILAAGVKRELDRQALYDYLTVNYVPGPRSIFKGIKKLAPGHLLVWEKGRVALRRYWKPERIQTSAREFGKEKELEEELLALLEEAVKYHLVSDVPVGAFLSGGIDSSAVVALASKLYPKKLKTFSVGFEQESYDELKYASQIARQFKTDHQEIRLKLNPQELVEKIGAYFDEPFADSSAVAVYAISEVARKQKLKVILTGDGGDEIFGGYVTYQADRLLNLYNRLPRWIRDQIIAAIVRRLPASHEKMTLEFKAKRFIRGAMTNPLKAHFLWKVIFTNEQIKKLLAKSTKARRPVRLWEKVYEPIDSADTLNKLMLADTRTSLVDDMLTKVDRMSMANSLEVRVPLLDHKLVEFMLKLPSQYKVRGLRLKYLLKKSLRGILPNEILDRPKAGFHVPVAHWIKDELRDLIGDYLSPTALKKQGLFKPEYVQQLLKDHNSLKADYSREIWGLLMLAIWQERYLKS
jgi:asparagine synthase (glutamine-hydrolysing)